MNEKERLLAILADTNIDGLNPDEAVARFGDNPILYFKIIKTFVDSMSAHIDKLRSFATSESTLSDYAIEVHGLKGSCYGIGANREGDYAKTLEIAAKDADYAAITSGNEPFIQTIEVLVDKLRDILAQAAGNDGNDEKKASPDKDILRAMLDTSRNFDTEAMQSAAKELEKYEYEDEDDNDLVRWLIDRVTAFAYDEIQERLEGIL